MGEEVPHVQQRIAGARLLEIDQGQPARWGQDHLVVVEIVVGHGGGSPRLYEGPQGGRGLLERLARPIVLQHPRQEAGGRAEAGRDVQRAARILREG